MGSIKNKKKLKIITVNIPEDEHDLLKELVRLGKYPSVCEAVRSMLNDWVKDKIDSVKAIATMSSMLKQINDAVEENAPKTYLLEHPEKEVVLNEDVVYENGVKTRIREIGHKIDKNSFITKISNDDGFLKTKNK